MSLNELAAALANAVVKTREFLELKQAQASIEQKRDLKIKVDEYKKKQQEIVAASNRGNVNGAKISALNEEFKNLSKIPEVNRYLTAMGNFSQMMAKTFKAINDSIESELNRG